MITNVDQPNRKAGNRPQPSRMNTYSPPVRGSAPGHACEVMVAYAYDTIARRNPLGFFGMVHVLEGTSSALATVVPALEPRLTVATS